MQHYNVNTLYEVFAKFDTTKGSKVFDASLLNVTLQSLGVHLSNDKLELLITEYSNDINKRQLDFGQFNQDFEEF